MGRRRSRPARGHRARSTAPQPDVPRAPTVEARLRSRSRPGDRRRPIAEHPPERDERLDGHVVGSEARLGQPGELDRATGSTVDALVGPGRVCTKYLSGSWPEPADELRIPNVTGAGQSGTFKRAWGDVENALHQRSGTGRRPAWRPRRPRCGPFGRAPGATVSFPEHQRVLQGPTPLARLRSL